MVCTNVCVCVHNCINIPACALYIHTVCQLSVFLHLHLACQSVSQCMCRRSQRFSVWVAGICLSIAFLPVFLCLSCCQAASQKCLQKERSHLAQLKGSPQRKLRSQSISVGICDCQPSDKMPPGKRSVLRQAGILHRADECGLEALSGTKAALLKLNTSAYTSRVETERGELWGRGWRYFSG